MSMVSGGCLCGRIRYTATAAPAFTGICHCRDCQRATGSAFGTVVAFPREAVTILGDLRHYQGAGDSGRSITRGFCPNCGSSLTVEVTTTPELLLLAAGTLDDPAVVHPTAEIFCDSAQPWVQLRGERRRFPRQATRR
ncbi:GFA family protein [Rhodovastum atsumiense]|uniref:GFA family protein n=1 Tax=Rhodovastum atsumiense TaxID=504468 RepID=A0A5M6IMD0_9PROT|nr:GFA family protein [Rhodovastum atsumiense]KAA5609009.1 GFA family protein [Rhodovastum atsumiense]CAH2599075.1 GFA family protein [Rhodovastum atsumiense]